MFLFLCCRQHLSHGFYWPSAMVPFTCGTIHVPAPSLARECCPGACTIRHGQATAQRRKAHTHPGQLLCWDLKQDLPGAHVKGGGELSPPCLENYTCLMATVLRPAPQPGEWRSQQPEQPFPHSSHLFCGCEGKAAHLGLVLRLGPVQGPSWLLGQPHLLPARGRLRQLYGCPLLEPGACWQWERGVQAS